MGKYPFTISQNMPALNSDHKLIDALERHVQPLQGVGNDYDQIIQAARGNASGSVDGKKFILVGEATHGTAEFYRIRAEITRRLIMEEGFYAVAVEADWPDAYRANRYISGQSDDTEAGMALSDFERFPTWILVCADQCRPAGINAGSFAINPV